MGDEKLKDVIDSCFFLTDRAVSHDSPLEARELQEVRLFLRLVRPQSRAILVHGLQNTLLYLRLGLSWRLVRHVGNPG